MPRWLDIVWWIALVTNLVATVLNVLALLAAS
jgi:hypothetical protein